MGKDGRDRFYFYGIKIVYIHVNHSSRKIQEIWESEIAREEHS